MSVETLFAAPSDSTLPIHLVTEAGIEAWLQTQDPASRSWLEAMRFRAERHQLALLPDTGGGVRAAAWGLGSLEHLAELEPWHVSGLPDRLPTAAWRILDDLPAPAATAAAYGWAYGHYRFDRYRSSPRAAPGSTLVLPGAADRDYAMQASVATSLARDLINTPAGHLDPERLAEHAQKLAREFGAACEIVAGKALADGYPAVHAVGRAAASPPRLIDLRWGQVAHPAVTLVGKGVCFDSGGLDIKTASGMQLMKKDMGGAACVLALTRMIMAARLRVRLRALIPAVENAISADAYRPGDVLRTRKGLHVEVGNTDAEGRLVLCDALAEADAERPALLIDLATLTGAARVALGPELPAVFGSRAATVEALTRLGRGLGDPLWPLPLWSGYDDELASKVADLNNVSSSGFAGAIIGGLFLRRFVAAETDWLHIDLYAWNAKERPGRPVGGEAQTVRALYALLIERYG
jgi:leucyl aminopeptidase